MQLVLTGDGVPARRSGEARSAAQRHPRAARVAGAALVVARGHVVECVLTAGENVCICNILSEARYSAIE